MTITIQQVRDTLMGWDIDVNVQAGTGETIASVEVQVNGFREEQDTPSDQLNSWAIQLRQKGVYPGDNQVDVLVTDQNGNQTRARKKW